MEKNYSWDPHSKCGAIVLFDGDLCYACFGTADSIEDMQKSIPHYWPPFSRAKILAHGNMSVTAPHINSWIGMELLRHFANNQNPPKGWDVATLSTLAA